MTKKITTNAAKEFLQGIASNENTKILSNSFSGQSFIEEQKEEPEKTASFVQCGFYLTPELKKALRIKVAENKEFKNQSAIVRFALSEFLKDLL